ncbi:Sugar (pentulose or hexulose) kinase [Chryseolinea serpens]|uniref:Sugar (Pentulose or hexulose) kinase n=1 Tax=Chryseolinea serpens TaxID=947013 RepID=A0A1M5TD53_9BACT|nr:Sugar (pentulose or hexulose) kinase [Chryseolinea serpens]
MIFDVGKTNKKILLFDTHYRLVFESSVQLPEIKDEDGFPCEDVHALTNWIKVAFEKILSDERFEVKAVNFSAYGASFVYVDENLYPVLTLYNYLKPYPDSQKTTFYEQYEGETEFSKTTASPVLGSLNSGMQLFRLKKERPEIFAKIKYALHLPQYLSSIITKAAYSEITSIGCHTNLWNFKSNGYHDWVFQEGIKEKLPPILKSDESFSLSHRDTQIAVGIGLHDSSSALIPYLASFHEPFVLLSTGTWCISLNPFNNSTLSTQELENDCLCYLTYKGQPVKASRLFAGYEHEQKVRQLADQYNVSVDRITKTEYNSSATSMVISDGVLRKTKKVTSQLHPSDINELEEAEKAYHELIIEIVQKQMISTKLVLQGNIVKRIFIDGGFSKNNIYMNLMAAVFPEIEIYAASIAQASALGAALAIHRHWNNNSMPTELIDLKFFKDATID